MISIFLLFIALQFQNTDSNLVTNIAGVPARSEVSREAQPTQNATSNTCDVKSHLADFAVAVQLAIRGLGKETYLYEDVPQTNIPPSIESISILDAKGKVTDSTISELIDKTHALPSSGQTKQGEYYIPLNSTLGARWILIKTKAE